MSKGLEKIGSRIQQLREDRGMSLDALAAEVSKRTGRSMSRQQISKYEKGKAEPKHDTLVAIAGILHASVAWLVDAENVVTGGTETLSSTARQVPLISWVNAGQWREVEDTLEPGDGQEFIMAMAPVGKNAFALKVRGNSMRSDVPGTPTFEDGDVIIVDPDIAPQPGQFVVAKLDNSEEATFKKYAPNNDGSFRLIPLNKDFPTLVVSESSPGSVVGVVTQRFQKLL